MTPVAQAISSALIQFIWQGIFVAFCVSLAMFFLRKQNPRIRYAVCCGALLILAALPVVTAIALYDPFASASAGPAAITLTIRAVWTGAQSSTALPFEHWLSVAQPWILKLWILGVVFFSMRLAYLSASLSSVRRFASPPAASILAVANALARRMGARRAIRVLVTANSDGPSVVGWLRPAILFPAATLLNLTPDQLEAILAHEIAHLRRYDDVVNIAQSVIETVLFYHPAIWWLSNRIRDERELCCDDLAVRVSGNPLCYARALTALERLRVQPPSLSVATIGIASSPLEYRIRRLVDNERTPEYGSSSLAGFLALSLAIVCLAAYSSPANGSAPAPPALVEYPESARIEGIQGTVPVRVNIDELGTVSGARAIGGPRELRQAAVKSATAMRFDSGTPAGTEQINVAFELAAVATTNVTPAPVPLQPAPPPPLRIGPGWKDKGESIIGLAANNEQDAVRQLDLLREWEQLYPVSELQTQRTVMTAHALLAVLGAAYGQTDPAILDAGKKAGQQLAAHSDEYLNDSTRDLLQIHTILAYIAQTEKDYDTAESELKKVLDVDPEDAGTSYQLGATILQQMATSNELTRYSEAIYDFARSLTITGPSALAPEMKTVAENTLVENYTAYHGGTDGLDELMKKVGMSALPPADFHIASATERVMLPTPELVLAAPKHTNLLARAVKGVFRLFRRLA